MTVTTPPTWDKRSPQFAHRQPPTRGVRHASVRINVFGPVVDGACHVTIDQLKGVS
ncbi:hypothetical protein GCM10029978_067110 [Actinoallomurus acanthiterrae]